MADLASLSADQLAEKARSIMGDHNERVAALAELQTRANQHDALLASYEAACQEADRLEKQRDAARATYEDAEDRVTIAEKERDEAREARDNWRQSDYNNRVRAEAAEARLAETLDDLARLYDDVDKAQKIDNTGGDSAVSVTLWSWAERRAALTTHPAEEKA